VAGHHQHRPRQRHWHDLRRLEVLSASAQLRDRAGSAATVHVARSVTIPIESGAYVVNVHDTVLVHDVVNVELGEPSVETAAVA
jgi:hypothetical protein